jgi:hypothetical protein
MSNPLLFLFSEGKVMFDLVQTTLEKFWKEISEGKNSKDVNLVSDKEITQTFFDVYNGLKELRKQRKISASEFIKGLIEIIKALSLFTKYENCFSEVEKKLQISVLHGYLEAMFSFLRDEVSLCSLYEPAYRVLKEVYEEGNISLEEYWQRLMFFVIAVTEQIHDQEIPYEKIKYLIPFLVAFLKFYQWILVEKSLASEGENSAISSE